MPKNKKLFASIGLSVLAAVIFAISASLKERITNLDLYLGTIWVFVLSLIISFSLSHRFTSSDNGKNDLK